MRRGPLAVVAVTIGALLMVAWSTTAASSTTEETALRAAKPRVVLTAPKEAVEGDRIRLRVRIPGAKRARRVVLQRHAAPVPGLPEQWTDVRRSRAKKRTVTFRVVAQETDRERYRAIVTYKDRRKPVRSRGITVRVWRWVPLSSFDPYQSTTGVASHAYTNLAINGVRYTGGWHTYGRGPTWESRHTPGRNCKAFRGIAGLDDRSPDGAAGGVTLLADDLTVYSSGTLTPGMAQSIDIALARPYRLTVRGASVTEDGIALPAIGNPELLCTDLD